MRTLAAALCLGLLAGVAWAGGVFETLDRETQKQLAETARAYFDPEVEFLWQPRKAFRATLADVQQRTGHDALVDIAFLREIVYQGRHFLPRFSDKQWQRENEISEFKKTEGVYNNLVSERYRFSYTLPKSYPKPRDFTKIPRPEAFPLLLSIHEERDSRERYPGGSVLKRRYPKGDFGDLYSSWLTVAPVAARAKFLEGGAIRHRFLTSVLTNFWRRYHVDFDRIVVDGAAPAAAMAAAFPHVFAGLVLRPGQPIDLDVVMNYASVPVFVAGDEALARELEQTGHPDVSVGDDAALRTWLGERRRTTATRFSWRWKRPDHMAAHWIVLTGIDSGAAEVHLAVETLDTDDDLNTIRIDVQGVTALQVFLNDEIVDLERPVQIMVNGEAHELGVLERDFGRLFEKDPAVRRNMNFGWLYTALHEIDFGPRGAGEMPTRPAPDGPRGSDEDEAKAEKLWAKATEADQDHQAARARIYYLKIVEVGFTSYRWRAKDRIAEIDGLRPELSTRLAAQQEWLEGRPDRLEQHLGSVVDAASAEHLLPFALRDLWWRPVVDDALLRACCERVHSGRDGILADQLRWALNGGGAPYPTHANPVWDPWPILTALVLERQQRETTGAKWLPDESPVLRRRVLEAPEEWQDWYSRWCAWFYDDLMRTAYEGEDPERLPEAFVEADREQARLADDVRSRNAWLALLAGVLFVGGAGALGRRASRA